MFRGRQIGVTWLQDQGLLNQLSQDIMLCQRHKQPAVYLCQSEDCTDSSPLCVNEECILAHSHSIQLSLINLSKFQQLVKQRRERDKDRMVQMKGKLNDYFKLIRGQVLSIVQERKQKVDTLDKVILQAAKSQGVTTQLIEKIVSYQFQGLPKSDQIRIVKMASQSVNKNMREIQLNELSRQVQRKTDKIKALIQKFSKSFSFKRLYSLKIYDRMSSLTYLRFQIDNSSWTFNTNKIDAIKFTLSQQVELKGFIHFPLIQFPADGVKLKITLYKNEQILASCQRSFDNQTTRTQFQVLFDQPMELAQGESYDVASENVGAYFQAKNGSNHKLSNGPFTFQKSNKDTNGTSTTSGQFKGFIVSKRM